MKNKICLLREHTFIDENKNPLLQEYDIEKLKIPRKNKRQQEEKDAKLLSFTSFLIDKQPSDQAEKIKQYFIENSIDYLYDNIEESISIIIQNASKISDNSNVISSIYEVFILNLENRIKDFEIERLKNPKARSYYKGYIDIFQLLGLKEKIGTTISFFENKIEDGNDTYLFIGSSFGEVAITSEKYNNKEYQNKVYVNLYGKTKQQLANLALVKIKLEEDFVSFKLKKLITFLYDFKLISENSYLQAIYGTTDRSLINLTRIGINPNISKVLKDKDQIKNIEIDSYGNLNSNDAFKEFINTQSELFKFEVRKYIK